MATNKQRVDQNGRHVNQRFGDRGRRVADVEGSGNQFIADDAGKFIDGGGGREGADSQGVEEIGDETDDEFHGRGPAQRGAASCGAQPAHDEGRAGQAEGDIQGNLSRHSCGQYTWPSPRNTRHWVTL